MDKTIVLKAIADETRMKILSLLLKNNYCVRALAKELELSEATISQHLKIMKEAGLLTGEKRGYFMHYSVNRVILHELADEIEALANIEHQECSPEIQDTCSAAKPAHCHNSGKCNEVTKEICHGKRSEQ